MLNCQPQPARTGRSKHQPVGDREESTRSGRVLAEQLVVDAEVFDCDSALRHCRLFHLFQRQKRASSATLGHPTPHRASRAAIRPGMAGNRFRSSKYGFPFADPNPSVEAKSSQNGHPVSGLKCHWTISRTCASSCAFACLIFAVKSKGIAYSRDAHAQVASVRADQRQAGLRQFDDSQPQRLRQLPVLPHSDVFRRRPLYGKGVIAARQVMISTEATM